MKNVPIASDQQLRLPLALPEEERCVGELDDSSPETSTSLMAQVLERDNLIHALRQVRRNQGAPGIDGMSVDQLPDHLKVHWPRIRDELMAGRYRPQPVKRVLIPKPDGRMRKLGIPTVLDRFIQQALAQVVQRYWEPHFHDHSYGFRPGRSAHHAVRYAQRQIREGKDWVIDLDLDAFFDRVNHGRLIRRLYRHLPERGLVQLINRYLKAGVMIDQRRIATTEGVPQGGPLSPVLSNVVLDELDWELERRGHAFARYADDCNIFVASRRSGERVMASLQRFIEHTLRLKVNASKSAVDRPWKRSFLGFTFSRKGAKVKVAAQAIDRLKAALRALSLRTRGHSLSRIIRDLRESLLGWKAYFDLAEVLSPLRDLDKWLRRRLRCYQWKQWGRAGYRELRRRGVRVRLAWNTSKSAHGPWRISHSPALYQALPTRYFRDLGLPELAAR
jgi:RNA-directed DNA polymerase